jgi:hypothetical protein
MPGYRELPESLTGAAADRAREAARLEQAGDRPGAAQLYEAALAASLREWPEVPAFLCGRLAMLYRTLGRHADEVALLEKYRDSQRTDEARTRFDARLSKASALAVKNQPRDSTALASVRAIRSASESRSLRRVAPDSENRKLG